MTRVDIVHYVGATTYSNSVIASLAADRRDEGHDVRILDISPWSTVSQDLPPGWIVRLLGHRVVPGALEKEWERLGVRHVTAPPDFTPQQPIPDDVSSSVYQSLESEMLTYFRREHLPRTGRYEVFRERLDSHVKKTYWWLHEMWGDDPPDFVCIPNGRTSRQKAAWRAAEARSLPVRIYEIGRARPHSYYYGTTQPHDRLGSQEEINRFSDFPTEAEMRVLSHEWLASRTGGESPTNEFMSLWNSYGSGSSFESPTAVFFTSSVDELLASGPMWTIDQWDRPFEAFDLIMSILEQQGMSLVMRLHPNLGSKSRTYFREEVRRVTELQEKHPSLVVHWHNSPINSYDLVRSAAAVIVERSTIGLEASLMGKPVWVTRATQWDLTADVRQVLSPSDVTEEILRPWQPDTRGAEKFVAYWMLQEHEFRYHWSHWASWNPEAPPVRLKIARLATKNSWSHRFHLVSTELTRRRNNRFRPTRSPRQTG